MAPIIKLTNEKEDFHMTTPKKPTSKKNDTTIKNSTVATPIVTTTSDDAALTRIVTTNLKNLIVQHNMTQKELALTTGYCEAAVCRYFGGKQFPPIDFLFKLKKLYNISIDDFISRPIFEPLPETDPLDVEKRRLQEIVELDLYRKYCGNYLVYYLDTNNYKGRDYNSPSESLVYGVINIHEIQTNLNKSEFECIAFLGIENREDATTLKKKLDTFTTVEELTSFTFSSTDKPGQNNIYTGDFEFGAKHAYISLKHGNIDRALIVLYRVETNKEAFNGGLGVINSGSKGREKMPTAQFMAFSRHPISLSAEEIHHELLLTYPTFKANEETKELITMFKNTYLTPASITNNLSEYQKELMLKVCIEDAIRNIISKNMDRYAKISERDDSAWYHLLKEEEIKRQEKLKSMSDL